MVREDRVIMSVKELRRVHVIRQTREKKHTQVKAGTVLGLTPRHNRRLIARVAQAGDHGLAHRGRGKPSNRRLPEKLQTKALTLCEKRYGDVGPTLAAEQLAEHHGITLSDETLRGWLLARGDTLPAAKAPASVVAGAEGTGRGTGTTRWLAPRLVRGTRAPLRADGVHR